jgi:hypothetical protein
MDAIKRAAARLNILQSAARQVVAIRRTDFARRPGILVYQMGKVGSTSVYAALRALRLPAPVHQVHFLSRSGLDSTRAFYRSVRASPWQEHVLVGRALARALDRYPSARWKLVTLVRDPIARELSGWFQHVETAHGPLVRENGQIAARYAPLFQRELEQHLAAFDEATDFAATWFDRELKSVFGIDVYATPFPHARGFDIQHHPRADLLVLRVEDLPRVLAPALRRLLDLPPDLPIETPVVNAADPRLAPVYAAVRAGLKLPPGLCARIYASRLARHFYTDAEIAAFTDRWTTR